ncbi:MAG: hypothetical protein GXO45_00085 [Aquificae bacterium]|nr:hypothetical protein [Aquificota bacterium]
MNRITVFFVVAVVGILLGWGIGSYLTYNKTMEAVGKIPASPIVVKALYDKPIHAIVFSVFNPGTVPLNIKRQSFVFKPGKETTEKGYSMQNIPVDIPLPPLTITTVVIKLKKDTQELKVGDVVNVELEYIHPLSPDRYIVKHGYEHTKEAK